MKQANEFIGQVRQDETLRAELQAVENDMEQLLALARREGYEFSQAEFVAAVRDIGYELETSISDEELNRVSGGQGDSFSTCGGCESSRHTGCGNSCDCPSTNWPQCG